MSTNQLECSRCGRTLMTDGPARNGSQPIVCAQCREMLQVNLSRGAYRPLPAVSVMAESADSLADDFAPAWQLAFTEAMPWAMSIAFHLAVLLVLTFATMFIEPASRGVTAADADDTLLPTDGPRERVTATGDSERTIPIVQTSEMKEPQRGVSFGLKVPDPGDGGFGGGKAGGDNSGEFVIGIPGPNGKPNGGSGEGDGSGGSPWRLGTPDGNGTGFFPIFRGAKSVVFVVDASGSLNANFDYVKVELRRTIQRLQGKQQFDVIFFSGGPLREMPINNLRGLQHASPNNRDAAIKWVAKQFARGETEPAEALRRAMTLKPELICFLTDGLIPRETVDELARMNKDHATQINTIGFVSKEGEAVLKEIARAHRGDYRFVSEDDLRKFEEE